MRPKAQLGDVQRASRSAAREPEADDDGDRRARSRRCASASPGSTPSSAPPRRATSCVDYVGSIDGEPFEGGEGRDQLIELGSGRLIPGFEEQLMGAKAGDDARSR